MSYSYLFISISNKYKHINYFIEIQHTITLLLYNYICNTFLSKYNYMHNKSLYLVSASSHQYADLLCYENKYMKELCSNLKLCETIIDKIIYKPHLPMYTSSYLDE